MPLVLIPCKSLAFGKSRLSPLLDASEREALCRDLLINTLSLAVDLAGTANVFLVSADVAAGQIAKGTGVKTYGKEWPDLNSALFGIREELIKTAHWDQIIVLPIDLPLATKATIQSAAEETAEITIVPDRRERGTNVLAIRGQTLLEFPFAYGEGSFAKHLQTAAEHGWSLSTRRIPALAFDIDEPEDYLEWKKLQAASSHAVAAKY
ncbi:MAG: 2-phospho-L-lactate guanylyltransferase [Xanthobacteraceae bacterium]|nr:MAG: 2-phospho-L-lactate guanylyltransferase [Xanthobacteraceae bacterium]